jgi:hypothetical protein
MQRVGEGHTQEKCPPDRTCAKLLKSITVKPGLDNLLQNRHMKKSLRILLESTGESLDEVFAPADLEDGDTCARSMLATRFHLDLSGASRTWDAAQSPLKLLVLGRHDVDLWKLVASNAVRSSPNTYRVLLDPRHEAVICVHLVSVSIVARIARALLPPEYNVLPYAGTSSSPIARP